MDLGKLLCSSHGALGILTEVALKALPIGETRATLLLRDTSPRQTVQACAAALATPFEVPGAAWVEGRAWLRIEGLAAQVVSRRHRLASILAPWQPALLKADEGCVLWRDLRDVRPLGGQPGAVWRILTKPSLSPDVIEALKPLGGSAMLDRGGGLIWYRGHADAVTGQGIAMRIGGAGAEFPRLAPGVAAMSEALRRAFDPARILNPGHMSPA